jgi:hypothetical protein
MIFPVLSPEMKELTLERVHSADTDPVCPTTALKHLSFSQKYIEPFPIPDSMKSFFYFLYCTFSGSRQSAIDGLKFPNYPLLELTVLFSKEMNKISFTVAATSDF